jgi:hypothetical protein
MRFKHFLRAPAEYAILTCDPFRDVDRTFQDLRLHLGLNGARSPKVTPNHVMVAELVLGVKESQAARAAG